MPQDPFAWIDERAAVRRAAGLARGLRPRPAESPLLDLASNDYLGLARHPEVTEAAAAAARAWGAGATGSRLVTGSTELHAELEAALADFCGFESAYPRGRTDGPVAVARPVPARRASAGGGDPRRG
ncbi:aminotransferase class I/II-fold pyridoxal phosphate-dependent enzyme, partial [Streptomyces sp. NPDC048845]|uniref:aminotransferase class I/II-fold pyridoxal phosphate-dependent enzyme n=1 Tax=Streptomyces sp. NPDC048845 TaxID=3155390 RepID=UPI00342E9485